MLPVPTAYCAPGAVPILVLDVGGHWQGQDWIGCQGGGPAHGHGRQGTGQDILAYLDLIALSNYLSNLLVLETRVI